MSKSDISVVIQAFDGYAPYWPTWYWSWTRYWDFSLPWPVYFCSEELDPPWNDPRITNIKTGRVALPEYSIKSIRLAEAVKTPYIFYMVDDFWPTDKVDKDLFADLLTLTRERNFNCLKIQCNQDEYHTMERTDIFCRGRRLLKFAKNSNYIWNTQAAIWKRGFFLDTVVAGEDPWQMESHGTERIWRLPYDHGVYMYHWPWYTIPSAVWQGKLSEPAKQIQYTAASDRHTIERYDVFGLQPDEKVVQSGKGTYHGPKIALA